MIARGEQWAALCLMHQQGSAVRELGKPRNNYLARVLRKNLDNLVKNKSTYYVFIYLRSKSFFEFGIHNFYF